MEEAVPIVLEDIRLRGCSYAKIWIGCTYLAAVCSSVAVPLEDARGVLRSAIGITGSFLRIFETEAAACEWIAAVENVDGWTEEERHELVERINYAQGFYMGHYQAPDGTVYFRRGGHFYQMSAEDSKRIYRLAVFGGPLGLHKFAQRRYLAGIGYLLTCGCFGWGVVLDLIMLVTGRMKDRQKCYYAPLRGKELALFPVGAVIAACWPFVVIAIFRRIPWA